jgi:hypothetical protein
MSDDVENWRDHIDDENAPEPEPRPKLKFTGHLCSKCGDNLVYSGRSDSLLCLSCDFG